MLIVEDPNQVQDKIHWTKLTSIVGRTLIWLSYNVFVKKYGTIRFDSFECPEGVNPLFFSQSCVYYYSDVSENHTLGVTSKVKSFQVQPKTQMTCLKKDQQNFTNENGQIGHVTLRSKKNPVCIPGNSVLTVPGHTSKIPPKVTCLVEQAEHHNLLSTLSWIGLRLQQRQGLFQ